MTEAEWLACDDPIAMLDAVWRNVSARKLRHFAVACCRDLWPLLTDERSRAAVEIAERYAEGLVGREELGRARDHAREAHRRFNAFDQLRSWRAAGAVQDATRDNARSAALNAAAESSRAMNPSDMNHFDEDAMRRRATFLRCIIGNPFRPQAWDSTWLMPSVVALAKAIYDGRSYDRLPELADALQEVGCEDAAILAHCREAGEHARGCWVVDAVLGLS